MAKIGNKDLNNLEDWNIKELRKLKINIKNRLSALSTNPKKEASNKSILYGLSESELKSYLDKILRAEKQLS